MDEYSQENVLVGPIMNARAIPMYNLALDGAETEGMNVGIGPRFEPGAGGFIAPTHTFETELEITVAGIRMQMVHVPSEAESELCVWLPDDRVLLSAEVVQDHSCPNIYTLRGAKPRDAKQWYESIDLMRQWTDAEHMVLQHGPPVSGGDEVAAVLRGYRDGIQYQHDQTLRPPTTASPRTRSPRRCACPRTSRPGRPGCGRSTGRWPTTCRPSSTATSAGSTVIPWRSTRRRGRTYAGRLVRPHGRPRRGAGRGPARLRGRRPAVRGRAGHAT